MNPDDLRTRLEYVLANTTAGFVPEGFERMNTRHGEDGGGHVYHGACALCRGEIGTLLDAVMPVVEDAIHQARRPPGTCRECWEPATASGFAHHMSCSQRVGPVKHRMSFSSSRPARDQERRCYCGTEWTVPCGTSISDWNCPNAAETWRGPMPARDELA